MPDNIPFDHDFPQKPETLSLCCNTGVTVGELMHRMFLMWRIFDRQTEDGRLPGLGVPALVFSCGGDEAFWLAVAAVGWLIVTPQGLEMPGFKERFRSSAKQRMREFRERKRNGSKAKDARGDAQCDNPGATDAAQNYDPTPSPTPDPKIDETSRDDQISLDSEETRERVREWCNRKFRAGPDPIFGGKLQVGDRAVLLKLGALVDAGKIPEAWIESALEAIRRHNGAITNRVAYLQSIVQEQAAMAEPNPARKAGALNRLLVRVTIPAEMLATPKREEAAHVQ